MPRPQLAGKWKWWICFLVLLIVILSAADYIAGVNSDAMASARESLMGSSNLQRRIGSIRSVELRWLWGFRVKSAYAGDKATLNLSIAGSGGEEEIVVDMQEVGGRWIVVRTSAPI